MFVMTALYPVHNADIQRPLCSRSSDVWFWVVIPAKPNVVSVALFCHTAVKTGQHLF